MSWCILGPKIGGYDRSFKGHLGADLGVLLSDLRGKQAGWRPELGGLAAEIFTEEKNVEDVLEEVRR